MSGIVDGKVLKTNSVDIEDKLKLVKYITDEDNIKSLVNIEYFNSVIDNLDLQGISEAEADLKYEFKIERSNIINGISEENVATERAVGNLKAYVDDLIDNLDIDLSNYYTKDEVDNLIPTIPINVSAFTNDVGYITASDVDLSNYYTISEVDALIAGIDLTDFYTKSEVDALIPTVPTNISVFTNDVGYITQAEVDFSDYYTISEVDSLIDNVTVDLSNYYTKSETDSLIVDLESNINIDNYYTKSEVDILIPTIPTDISSFTNDVGYITATDIDLSDYYTKSEVDGLIPIIPVNVSEFNNDVNYQTEAEVRALLDELGDYMNLVGVGDTLPSTGSTGDVFLLGNTGDSNFAQYVYIDGGWVEIGNTSVDLDDYYTKTEVDTLIPTLVSQLANDEEYIKNTVANLVNYYDKTTTDNLIASAIPTNVSTFINDAGYITSSDIDLSNYYTISEVDNLIDNVTVDLTNYYTISEVDSLIPTVPTDISAFTNDVGYITASDVDLSNYYTISEVDALIAGIDLTDFYTKSEVDALIPIIPTNVSEFDNDANYIDKTVEELDNFYNKDEIEVPLNDLNYRVEVIEEIGMSTEMNDLTDVSLDKERTVPTIIYQDSTGTVRDIEALEEGAVISVTELSASMQRLPVNQGFTDVLFETTSSPLGSTNNEEITLINDVPDGGMYADFKFTFADVDGETHYFNIYGYKLNETSGEYEQDSVRWLGAITNTSNNVTSDGTTCTFTYKINFTTKTAGIYKIAVDYSNNFAGVDACYIDSSSEIVITDSVLTNEFSFKDKYMSQEQRAVGVPEGYVRVSTGNNTAEWVELSQLFQAYMDTRVTK